MRPAVVVALAVFLSATPANSEKHKTTNVGYIEYALIVPEGLKLKAKMDTGAKTTSIHAANIERYKNSGKDWVRFTIKAGGRSIVFRRKVYRISRIRRTKVGVVERLVVKIGICLAGYYKLAQVNLTDRSNMNYPMLIGRRFMESGRLVIDSGAKFVGKPICSGVPAKK